MNISEHFQIQIKLRMVPCLMLFCHHPLTFCPGWIKTLTRYYQDQTSKILDQMVIKMQEHPKMTFIWAEISYFSMWWDTADYGKKQVVKR